MKKGWQFSNWHGGVMFKAVVHEAHAGEYPFPAGPRAFLSWFQSGRKGLGSCNRFEELKQVVANSLFRDHSGALFLGRQHLVFLTKEMVKKTM